MKKLLKIRLFVVSLVIILPTVFFVGNQNVNGATTETNSNTSLIGGLLELALETVTNITFGSGSIVLDGSVQTLTSSPETLIVKDSTGEGKGWHVTVQATPFLEVAPLGGYPVGYTNAPRDLPAGSLTLKTSGASIVSESLLNTSPKPIFTGSEWIIDKGQVVILEAGKNEGMGVFHVEFAADALTLTLDPGQTYVSEYYSSIGEATPYSSTITWTITNGPSL